MCLRLLNISSRDVLDPAEYEGWFLFCDCFFWYPSQCFTVLFIAEVFQKQQLELFYKKAVLKNLAIFTGKPLCRSHFLIKLQAFKPINLLKRDSYTDVFIKVGKLLRTPILKNLCEQLLLVKVFVLIAVMTQAVAWIWKLFKLVFFPSSNLTKVFSMPDVIDSVVGDHSVFLCKN